MVKNALNYPNLNTTVNQTIRVKVKLEAAALRSLFSRNHVTGAQAGTIW